MTDLRPRGEGFDLSVDARVDTGRWLQVSGSVSQDRGLVTIAGSAVASANAPEAPQAEQEAPAQAVPLVPAEVVFSSPYEGEVDVPVTTSVRIQFSRGLDPDTIAGQIRVDYVGPRPKQAHRSPRRWNSSTATMRATRAIEITFTQPPDRFRTLRVELLEGLKTFDGAPVSPWTLTFAVGG